MKVASVERSSLTRWHCRLAQSGDPWPLFDLGVGLGSCVRRKLMEDGAHPVWSQDLLLPFWVQSGVGSRLEGRSKKG